MLPGGEEAAQKQDHKDNVEYDRLWGAWGEGDPKETADIYLQMQPASVSWIGDLPGAIYSPT